tara:strand:- start:149 stop:262 length:114 start_codon:yes stop_codon:yes gene_type:complete
LGPGTWVLEEEAAAFAFAPSALATGNAKELENLESGF